jgi:hypothetical protein
MRSPACASNCGFHPAQRRAERIALRIDARVSQVGRWNSRRSAGWKSPDSVLPMADRSAEA